MVDSLATYDKKHDFLICIDSDGCGMDTMDIKHHKCFGPCMVAQWELEEWSSAILKRWNDINLYTLTRGINRFKGLSMALKEIDEVYKIITDIEGFSHWVDTTDALSEKSLEKAIEASPANECLAKALEWSKDVNRQISMLHDDEKRPFEGLKEVLQLIHTKADVAIVSSANKEAVLEEWKLHELLDYVDIIMAQDNGTKQACIANLVKEGYANDHVLMIGDALGDKEAAERNSVYYYPILAKMEVKSWGDFLNIGMGKFFDGTYGGSYHQELLSVFLDNLTQ